MAKATGFLGALGKRSQPIEEETSSQQEEVSNLKVMTEKQSKAVVAAPTELTETSLPPEPPRQPVRPMGVQAPFPGVRAQDRDLMDILGKVLTSTVIVNGGVNSGKILRYLLQDPVAFQRLGKELGEKLYKSGGASVIAGVGGMATCLMQHVASAYNEIQLKELEPGAPTPTPAFSFPLDANGEELFFPGDESEALLRGKTVFLVVPVVTEKDWDALSRIIDTIEERGKNTSVVGVGIISLYGKTPLAFKDTFRFIPLLHQLGLGG